MPSDQMGTAACGAQVEEFRSSLERVLEAPAFGSKRRGNLLRYLAEHALAGTADRISEYAIGLDVFGKPESFDPRAESTVRAEMSRLRKTLAEYYAGPGAADPWRIELPAGGYVPVCIPAPETASKPDALPRRRFRVLWLPALVFCLAAAGIAVWRLAPAPRSVRSVVVLPFLNLTGDPGNDYLADGITEDLTDALAHIPSLRVVARTSAFQFKGKAVDIREIGRLVNADAVVEGSLQSVGGRLRATLQLNRAADGYHVLSRAVEGGRDEVSRLETEMVTPVLAILRPQVRPARGRTPDPQAVDLVLRARVLRGYGSLDRFKQGVELLKQAVARDPQYSGAWAELASAYAGAATSISPDPVRFAEEAKADAARALELDPNSAEAHAAAGYADAMVLLNWRRGAEEIRLAARLMPQNALIHQRLANVLLSQARFREALAEARVSEQLDPLIANSGVGVGMVLFMQRNYAAAVAQWRRVAAVHPDVPAFHQAVGMGLEGMGDFQGARAEYQSVADRFPHDIELRTIRLLAVSGHPEEALRRQQAVEAKKQDDPFTSAVVYGDLGRMDDAFAALERAWQLREYAMFKVHPFLDPLRRDPRFAGLLQRAGLE